MVVVEEKMVEVVEEKKVEEENEEEEEEELEGIDHQGDQTRKGDAEGKVSVCFEKEEINHLFKTGFVYSNIKDLHLDS